MRHSSGALPKPLTKTHPMVKQKINVADLFEGAAGRIKNPKSVAAGKAGVAVRLATLERRHQEAIARLEAVPLSPKAAKRAGARPVWRHDGYRTIRAEPNNGAMSIEAGILIAMQPRKVYAWFEVWLMVDWMPHPGRVRGALCGLRKRGLLDWKRLTVGRMCHKARHGYFLTAKGLKFREVREKEVAQRVEALGEKEFMRRLYAGKVAWLLS